MTFDDDLFDCEIIVERAGRNQFDRYELAAFLGVHPHSIWRMVHDGDIPGPRRYEHHEESLGHSGGKMAIWTCGQVAQILLKRRRRVDA